ncbi:MAG TPA: TraR/DksA C4-type zinc finger protein [Thermodesulfovibrionales bacterium]|nr:TraR/DksA C4-type zinc finger protein [Thermodesulfovibrionales bacterium]
MVKKPATSLKKKEPKTKKKEVRKKTSAKKPAPAASKTKKIKKPARTASRGRKKPAEAVKTRKRPQRASSTRITKVAGAAPKTSSRKVTQEELLKKQLIGNREEIVREAKSEIAKYIKGETRQLVETVLDDGDWSVIDLSEDINLRRLAAHREVLLKIDEALRKIREGTYGTCEECGEAINSARLKVLPFAIYCRDCQEKKEEMEKVEGEEL